jgi:microcystin-dependent protein
MSDPYIGEIRMFGGNFAPRNWALCDGQLIAISSNSALFSLLGTIYGGDGRTTFALPDMRGRLAIHQGTGPGLSNRRIGNRAGQETVTLTANTVGSHTHNLNVSSSIGTTTNGSSSFVGVSSTMRFYRPVAGNTNLSVPTISPVGNSQAHANTMPFQCVNFIIALQGVFPSRN